MIQVMDTVQLKEKGTLLVCEVFADEIITETIKTNIGVFHNFAVEMIKECFSKPKTRDLLVYGGDYTKIKEIEFI